MKWRSISLVVVLLTGQCFRTVTSDERPDVGHDEDVHPHILTETSADALDMNVPVSRESPDTDLQPNWDVPDLADHEDADWHPPPSLLESHADLLPDARLVTSSGSTGVGHGTNPTFNRTLGGSSAQCGEFSGQLRSDGQCRLTATLPPAGTSQQHCPDVFRCTDDVSYWLHQNQNRKEQLDELEETMAELQEEQRNHRHRVKALEVQVDVPLLSTEGGTFLFVYLGPAGPLVDIYSRIKCNGTGNILWGSGDPIDHGTKAKGVHNLNKNPVY